MTAGQPLYTSQIHGKKTSIGAGSDVITERSELAEASNKSPIPSGKERNRSRIGDCLNITTGYNEPSGVSENEEMMGLEVPDPVMPTASAAHLQRPSTASKVNLSPSRKSTVSNSKTIYRCIDDSANVVGAIKQGTDGLQNRLTT